jgi:hypothetical protein
VAESKKGARKGRKSPKRKAPPESPESPPEASPTDGEEPSGDSRRASAKGSSAEPFVGEPGPEFDAAAAAGEPEPSGELHALPEPEPEWDEQVLGGLLRTQGQVLHYAVGVAERDWQYTEADLQSIAPPLARILNRYPTTRAVAGSADPLALAIAVGAYGLRSSKERAQALAELEAEEEEAEQPITGEPAPPGSGPPPGHPAAVGPPPPAPAAEPEGDFDPTAAEWKRD